MNLYLVRHGQTDFNKGEIIQGISDIPLNGTGIQQARALAPKIKDLEFDAYYVSPLLRARQTAEIITDGKADFQINNLLRERSYGEIEGQKVDLSSLGDVYDRRANISTYGIEPVRDLLARAQKFLDQLKTTHDPDAKILIVAHGALLRAMHFCILGYDDNTDFHAPGVRFQNCELREYDF